MMLRVLAVVVAISSKKPLSIYDNIVVNLYLCALNSKHCSPYQIERNCITKAMMDYSMLEFKKIVNERRGELGEGFVSTSSCFWTDRHCKQSFDAICADVTAERYLLFDGGNLFMSKAKITSLDDGVLKMVCVYILLIC